MPLDTKVSIRLRDLRYMATTVLVLSRDEQGRPKRCEFLYDDECTLTGQHESLLVYVPEPV